MGRGRVPGGVAFIDLTTTGRGLRPARRAALAIALLVVAVAAGGASRLDVGAPLAVRAFAVVVMVTLLLATPPPRYRGHGGALLFAGAIVALPLIQLIPLPWRLWSHLPGHDLPAQILATVGDARWMPISLTPDRTLNALGAMLPALAGYTAASRLDRAGVRSLFTALLVLATLSAMLGIAQFIEGPGGPLYVYAITNNDSSVGLFANANHHALFLCAGIVAAFMALAAYLDERPEGALGAVIPVIALVALLFLSILASRSRAGAGLAVLATAGGVMLLPRRTLLLNRRRILGMALVAGVAVGTVLALAFSGAAFERALQVDELSARRLDDLPVFARIALDFFPFGSGLGSFDPVFRSYENVATLTDGYLNNAHNDLAQIVIEGGLGAALLAAIGLAWFVNLAATVWRGRANDQIDLELPARHGRAASLAMALLLTHSLIDYPLRSAALLTLFALCAGVLVPAAGYIKTARRQRRRYIPAAILDALDRPVVVQRDAGARRVATL